MLSWKDGFHNPNINSGIKNGLNHEHESISVKKAATRHIAKAGQIEILRGMYTIAADIAMHPGHY